MCFKTLKNFYEFTSQIDEKFIEQLKFIEEEEENSQTQPYELVEYVDDDGERLMVEEHLIDDIDYFEVEEIELKPKEEDLVIEAEKYEEIVEKQDKFRRQHPKNDLEGEKSDKILKIGVNSRNCNKIPETAIKLPKTAINSPNCNKILQTARNFQKLQEISQNCNKFPKL